MIDLSCKSFRMQDILTCSYPLFGVHLLAYNHVQPELSGNEDEDEALHLTVSFRIVVRPACSPEEAIAEEQTSNLSASPVPFPVWVSYMHVRCIPNMHLV